MHHFAPLLVRRIILMISFFFMVKAGPSSYYITAPQYIVPGVDTALAVHLFGTNYSEITVSGEIWSNFMTLLSKADAVFSTDTIGILSLPKLPKNSSTSFSYNLRVKGTTQNTAIFDSSVYLSLAPVHIFIETDKVNYRPGQAVKIRVISTYHDLSPYKGDVDLVVMDPENNIVQKWQNLITDQGVVSTEFLLSFNPMFNKWQIQATTGGVLSSSFFSVTNNDGPIFDVTINVPEYYVYTKQQNLTGTVTAKDFFGKPISGSLTVSLRPFQYYFYDEDNYEYYYYDYYTINKTFEIVSGSVNFNFTHEDLSIYWYWHGTALQANAWVTDEITGTVRNTSANIKMTDSQYKFTMISEPEVPQYGLNYIAKLQIQRIDDIPLSKEERFNFTVTIHQYAYYYWSRMERNANDTLETSTSAYFAYSPTDSATSVSQKAVFNTSPEPLYTTTISSSDLQMPDFTTMVPISSVSSISTASVSTTPDSNTPLSTTLYSSNYHIIEKLYTVPESGIISIEFPIVLFYDWIDIQVRHENMYRNWQLQNPLYYYYSSYFNCNFVYIRISNSPKKVAEPFQVTISTFRKIQDLYYVVMAKDGVVATGKKSTTSFTLTPEQSWAPSVTLIVYLLNSDCPYNISKTSRKISIKGSFENKVNLFWSKSKLQPGENSSLSVNVGETHSLVGLRVVEKTVKENENDLTANRVNQELTPYCQDTSFSNVPTLEYNNSYYYNNYYTFDEFRPYYGEDLPLKQPEDDTIFFPETWLWLETNISSGFAKSIAVTAPLTNSTWVASAFVISDKLGLGFTEELVELAVSRPFFISVNLPFSVTRGEQFILEVTVYNYKAGQIVAMVTLEASDAFEVITNNDVWTVAGQIKVTVPMEDKETVLFPIRTKKLGKIPIKVKATSSSEESDAVSKTIYVKAEGVKHFYSEAAVFQVSDGGTASKTFSFSFPSDVVHDSEEAFVTVVGDILGPSIDGLESLIQMPYGCGEQNMINFAPNIYVLQYLIATKQIKEEIKKRAISYMEDGYQRELTYKRSDGSFSAFGNSDDSGSTWLSAFVFRCFLQAREFIFISKEVLDKTVQWLVQYQDMNTGIFSEPGRVIHTELQGGLNGPITLTAYILTSLLEDEIYKKMYTSRVDKAMKYLESKFTEGISSNYTLSVVVYALSLANSSKASIALDQLNSRADKTGGVMYWSSPSVTTYYWQPQSTDIETAAYALLSHRVQKRILEGIPIMKWLSQQRSQLGGYSSTQDTIMALQALSQFLIVNPSDDTSLTLTVTGPGSPVSISFQINSENLLLLQSQQITVSQPLSITVSASGRGIAIFQLNINYNQKASSRRRRSALIPEAFLLDVTVIDDEADIQRLSVDICTSYLGPGNESGMALLDVGFLSGFGLDSKGIPTEGSLKRVEPADDKVYLYFDSVSNSQICVSVPMVRSASVAGSQDSVITIVEYYNTRNSATRTYNSETMKKISSCDFCGLDCTSCQSNVRVDPTTTTVSVKPQTTTQRNTKTTSSSVQQALNVFTIFLVCAHYILWY